MGCRAGSVAVDHDHCITNKFKCTAAAAAAATSLQSCPTLCNPIDGSPPGSSIPGILQTRILEWVAISFSNAWKWKVKVKSLSRVRLLVTSWTTGYQMHHTRFSTSHHFITTTTTLNEHLLSTVGPHYSKYLINTSNPQTTLWDECYYNLFYFYYYYHNLSHLQIWKWKEVNFSAVSQRVT